MKIYVESRGNKSNYISFNKYKLHSIPYLAINNYFLISRENLYFLVLSLFQLSTYSKIGLLPSEWSPSGPFSTTIPLVLCFILEIFSLMLSYFNDLIKTYRYNYCKYINKKYDNNIIPIKFKDINVGDILIIDSKDIFPVDGIIIKTYSEKYGKINLSNLNGECDIICKESIENIIKNDINDIKLVKIKDYSNSIRNFDAIGIINNKYLNINHEYFVPGGAINSGNDKIMFLVTEVGKNIRSYTLLSENRFLKSNFLNVFISQGLTNHFVPLLAIFCISLVYFSTIHTRSINLLFIIEKVMQSWILLNGIVPFSIKLLIIINRNIQSYLYSNSIIEYINITSAENYNEVQQIICDKTGTITKNQLLLTHLSYRGKIYQEEDIHSYLPFDYIYNIVFGLHIKDNIYNTEEDKVIGHKILSCGTIIEYKDRNVVITYKKNKINIEILEMNRLEFDCDRKLSSVVFKVIDNNDIFIVTKGSIDSVRNIISKKYTDEFNTTENIYNEQYPFLRTIAFCVKKIDNYSCSKDPKEYEKSKKYKFLSILGIQDELQKDVYSTIEYLKNNNKIISICTGDRKETALYISNKIGILCEKYFDFKDNISIRNVKERTFIFSSLNISNSLKDYHNMEKFKNYLIYCKNFVAYSLMPKDKQYIANIFEAHDINVIAIGDGTNDIPMLNTSTIAIGVNNSLNNNVINNSDISIKQFSDLIDVNDSIKNFVNINLRTSFIVYYKTLLINSLIYFYILYNDLNFNNILFTFLDIQGNHLIWGFIPIISANFLKVKYINKNYIVKTASLYGIINAISIIYVTHYYNIFNNISSKTFILFLTIMSTNVQFIFIYGFNKLNITSAFMSFLFGILYIFSSSHI